MGGHLGIGKKFFGFDGFVFQHNTNFAHIRVIMSFGSKSKEALTVSDGGGDNYESNLMTSLPANASQRS